jgi:hypothetical protein
MLPEALKPVVESLLQAIVRVKIAVEDTKILTKTCKIPKLHYN